jgi:tetratricopeptide (TPR) repeat protein
MNRTLRTAFFAALLGGGTFLAMAAASGPAFATDAPEGIDTEISNDVAELYSDAAEAYEDMDFPTALQHLTEAIALPEKTPWETYLLEKFTMQLYLAQQDLPNARLHLDAAYDTGVMPEEDKQAFLKTGMLLSYNDMDYARAIQYGTAAMNYPGWDDQADEVLTTAYYFNMDFAGAETYAQSVIARKQAAGQVAPAQVLNTLFNVQLEQGRDEDARQTAGLIAVAQPTPENWARVIDNIIPLPGMTDRQFINLYRLRQEVGVMTGADFAGAAQMSLLMGLPAEAKTMVDQGVSTGAIDAADAATLNAEIVPSLAQGEQTLGEFAAEATNSATGDVGVQYGEALYTFGRLPEAEAAIRAGIQKGGLSTPGEAEILLGIVLLKQGRKEEAHQAFQQAEQMGGAATQPVAQAWRLFTSI